MMVVDDDGLNGDGLNGGDSNDDRSLSNGTTAYQRRLNQTIKDPSSYHDNDIAVSIKVELS